MPVANSTTTIISADGSQTQPTAHVTIPVATAIETSGHPSLQPVHAVPMMVNPGAGPAVFVSGSNALGISFTESETEVLRGRSTVQCLALIDCVLVFLNLFASSTGYGLFLLILIFGPIAGHYGAKRLKRNLVMFYLVFCILRVLIYVLMIFVATSTRSAIFWALGLLVYLYLTRIVQRFYSALGQCDPMRLEQILIRLRQGR